MIDRRRALIGRRKRRYLFRDGDEFTDYTGGFTPSKIYKIVGGTWTGKLPTKTMENSLMKITLSGNSTYCGSVFISNALDLTAFSRLTADLYTNTVSKNVGYTECVLGIYANKTVDRAAPIESAKFLDSRYEPYILSFNGEVSVDLSEISGTAYIAFFVRESGNNNNPIFYLREMYLE